MAIALKKGTTNQAPSIGCPTATLDPAATAIEVMMAQPITPKIFSVGPLWPELGGGSPGFLRFTWSASAFSAASVAASRVSWDRSSSISIC